MNAKNAIVELRNATLQRDARTLWEGLDITIKPGEFVAVLGPNGAGKTSLIKVLLGQLELTGGTALMNDNPAGMYNQKIGYVPQQKSFDQTLPLRGRDLVALGLEGTHFGLQRRSKDRMKRIDTALEVVKATAYADIPLGLLSGGEQQRLRIAQAIVSEPLLLLCDEPLLSLDLASQQTITSLLDEYRKEHQAAILFVTHEINPILPYVDTVLYIANGRWIADKPERVLTSETLSRLYGTPIEVLNIRDRLLVVGADDTVFTSPGAHHGGQA
jgi:zinc/manganese transport system ATP-binding protein